MILIPSGQKPCQQRHLTGIKNYDKVMSMAYQSKAERQCLKGFEKVLLYRQPKRKKKHKGNGHYVSKVIRKDGDGNIIGVIPAGKVSSRKDIIAEQVGEKRQAQQEWVVRQLRTKPTFYEVQMYKKLKADLVKQFNIKPIFQHAIHAVHPDKLFFVLDIYIPKAKIAVEIDGRHHNTGKQYHIDKLRDKILQAIGIKTVRFQNSEVYSDIKSCINTITGLVKVRLSGVSLTIKTAQSAGIT